jgi:dienelactone hydrolase
MSSFNISTRHPLFVSILGLIVLGALVLSCGGQVAGGGSGGDTKTSDEPKGFPQERIVLTTDDDVTIYGTIVYPDGNGIHPAVILCHQYMRDRKSYADFQNQLASEGLASLAIDFRGFGESVDKGVSYKNFHDQDFMNMLKDIKAALVFLNSETVRDRVDGQKVGLAGASIGANLAIMAGADIEGLKCIAALSPGRSWHGLEPLSYAPNVKIPSLIAYAKGDTQSSEVIPELTRAFAGNAPKVVTLEGPKHGTDMLAGGFDKTLRDWLKEQLSK